MMQSESCLGDRHEGARFGYPILPAIAALDGDGMLKAETQCLLSRAETNAQRLMDDCEAPPLNRTCSINHKYDAMRRGESELLRL